MVEVIIKVVEPSEERGQKLNAESAYEAIRLLVRRIGKGLHTYQIVRGLTGFGFGEAKQLIERALESDGSQASGSSQSHWRTP